MIGCTVKHFQITAEIGRGGMGVVYRAQDTKLERVVALKFLPPHLTADPTARSRFIHEAKAASSLEHPAICTIHEIGETDDGQTFLVMPCYEGETLQDRIARGPLPVEEAVAIFRQVAQGLALAHEQGLVHRDIKPANIFLTKTGQAVILDFGLAKLTGQTQLTQEGSTLGTVAYMSPEQAQGEEAGPESDFWSLGAVLYEMLTGRQPFAGEHPQAVLYAIGQVEPIPLTGVPDEIVELVSGLLGKERDQRRTAAEKLLPRYLEGGTVQLTGTGSGSRKWVGPAVLLVVLAVAVGCWLLWSGGRDTGIDSIAVLPFEDLSADQDQEYVSDGMTDQLISRLGTLGVFNKVISRSSVMRYKDDPKPAAEVGEELDVRALVEGTITFAGDRARVTAKLIDATTDKQLWSDSFDEPVTNILDLQARMVRAICGAIEKTLSPEVQGRLTGDKKVNPKAYRAYLRGVHWLDNYSTSMELHYAQKAFEEAIAADSTFAQPYAGLAEIHTRRTHTNSGVPPPDAIPNARKYLAKAFELDPDLAEAYMTQGHLQWEHEFQFKEAEKSFRKALELNPSLANAHMIFAYYLSSQCRHKEAAQEANAALALDPLSEFLYRVIAQPLIYAEEYEAAENVAITAESKFPDFPFDGRKTILINIYQDQKRWDKIVGMIEEQDAEATALADTMVLIESFHFLGNDTKARKIFDEVEERAKSFIQANTLAYNSALLGYEEKARSYLDKYISTGGSIFLATPVYAVLGDMDEAFDCLDRSLELRVNWLSRMKNNMRKEGWNLLQSDPRYEDLLRQIGFED